MPFFRTLSLALLLGNSAAHAFDREAVERGIKSMAPQVSIDDIRQSPVPGWAEVRIGAQILYVSADGKHLLNGSLYATDTHEDLSERSKAQVRSELLGDLPKEALISFAPAAPQARVTVFTAIDCGYCKQLHQQMASYHELGIAIDYVLIARSADGTPAELTTRGLHCADDPASAFENALLGRPVAPAAACPATGYEAGRTMAQRLGINSTPTFVFADGTVGPGYISAADLQTKLQTIAAR